MKRLIAVILTSAALTTIVVMAAWSGLKSPANESVKSAAAPKPETPKPPHPAKVARKPIALDNLRRETRELQKRVDELEKQLAEKRRAHEANSEPPKFVSECRYVSDDLKRLFVENPAEYTKLTNSLAIRDAQELKADHDNFLRKLNFLDEMAEDSASDEETAVHGNFRALLTLEHELDGILKANRNRMLILQNKARTPEDDIEIAAANKAYAAAWDELAAVRKDKSAVDTRERELLLGKMTKALGLPEDQQGAAAETIKAIFEATGDK